MQKTMVAVAMLAGGLLSDPWSVRADASLPAPVARWTFDEAGAEGRDSVGNHHGTVHGPVRHAGKLGGGLLFDRSRQDYVEVPHATDLELSTFTVSAWVWLTKPPTYSGIVGTRQGGAMLFDVKVNTDKVHGDIGDGSQWIETKVNFYKDDVGTNGQGGDLELERWYLVTFVIDGEGGECRLYLDGDRKKTVPFVGRPKLLVPGRTLRIGDTGAGEFMDGVIDDVSIYRESLSDAQVAELARQ
ncbi:MAG: LamG domain-containing protein [Planctomycetia bacterium]